MIYKESKENLFKQGLMKKCPVDWKAIKNLLKRGYMDLETAKRNIDDDEECGLQLCLQCDVAFRLSLNVQPRC